MAGRAKALCGGKAELGMVRGARAESLGHPPPLSLSRVMLPTARVRPECLHGMPCVAPLGDVALGRRCLTGVWRVAGAEA